jgi:hypothetical protein
MDEQERQAREMVRQFKRDYPEHLEAAGNRKLYNRRMAGYSNELICIFARHGDKYALKIARKRALKAMESAVMGLAWSDNETVQDLFHVVPPELVELALEIFVHGEPEGKRGPSDKSYWLRNQAIAHLVRQVAESFGFPIHMPYADRGNDSGRPMTACRIVGEELGLDDETIEGIHHDQHKTGIPV